MIPIDGNSLTPEILFHLSKPDATLCLTAAAWEKVAKGREVVDEILRSNKTVYGINTGFGLFSNVRMKPKDDLQQLQTNLIRSHAAGIGKPLNFARTKMLLALRINALAKGYSGISVETLGHLVKYFNHNVLSIVPEKGTVGASGDLAPLAHLALGFLGEGKMYQDPHTIVPAAEGLRQHQLPILQLRAKEGLALINGTQFISALACEAIVRSEHLLTMATKISALTVEVLCGTAEAFHEAIHRARPHGGQIEIARQLRQYLQNDSELFRSHQYQNKVQDPYTLRCLPQVHGVVYDTIQFVKNVIQTEINSATDNPMIISSLHKTLSGGNFHGEYPAKMMDYLAIAVAEIGNMSERRIERLMNPKLSGLPAFLVPNGGMNSGFMIAHCTAASLVSENKVLSHPASNDTISTSAAKEDHVSMGGFAARKVLEIIENVETIVAIELMCSCQALDFHRPHRTSEPLEELYELVRESVPYLSTDRHLSPDIEKIVKIIKK